MFQKINKKIFLALFDVMFIIMSYFLVIFLVRDNDYLSFFTSGETFNTIILVSIVFGITLYVLNFYSYIWIYTGIREYFVCAVGGIGAIIFQCLIAYTFKGVFLPIRYIIASGILFMCFAIGTRGMIKIVYMSLQGHFKKSSSKEEKLLIIGAGNAAGLAVREIIRENDTYDIVGIVDDDKKKLGCRVFGVKVMGTRYDIEKICKENDVEVILLAIPSIDNQNKSEILNICTKTNCKVKIMPDTLAMLDRIEFKKDVRDIEVEDLLERDVISLDVNKISEYIKDETVLVTGGGGSIGSEICRQVASYKPRRLIIVDIYENNAYSIQMELKAKYKKLDLQVIIASVRDVERLERIFDYYKPDIVFHAAAHKHVPLMEVSPEEAIKNNIIGTLNTAKCADKYNVEKFVLISTDKAVNPTNVMGATKRFCEMIIQSINKESKTEFVAVRFGNVLGSNGSVVPLFKKQIEKGGPVTVTHREITRYFMTIPEASQLVLEAATLAKGGEIFVLDMGEPVKIYDLATNMIKLAGYKVGEDIEIKVTGLRPGEKLYEELLMSEEGLTGTVNKKIFVARPAEFDFKTISERAEELLSYAKVGDEKGVRTKLKEFVPTFKEEKIEEDIPETELV